VGKGKRVDVYLEVRKEEGAYIFLMKQVPVRGIVTQQQQWKTIHFFFTENVWSMFVLTILFVICLFRHVN
jgi:hypothetical protein